MTAQTTWQADDGQLAQEDDQAILENNLMEPEAELAEQDAAPMRPDADRAEQDADLTAPQADLAEADADPMAPQADPMAPDAEQTGLEDPTSHPAGVTALADQESATSIVRRYPGFTPGADAGAEEPGTPDSSPSSPSLVTVAFTVPESATESHIAGNAASAGGPWNEIQAMFVDDPRASVERAAGLVSDQVEALIRSFTERQRFAQSAWEADDAGTEELRVALQHYRAFWNSIVDFSPQG
jgi:hypothetical protein